MFGTIFGVLVKGGRLFPVASKSPALREQRVRHASSLREKRELDCVPLIQAGV